MYSQKETFQEYRISRALPNIRFGLLMSALMYSAFSLLDPVLLPDKSNQLLIVRLGIILPTLIAVYLLTYHKRIHSYFTLAASFTIFISSAGLYLIILMGGETFIRYYFPPAAIVLIFGVVLSRLHPLATLLVGIASFFMFLHLYIWGIPQSTLTVTSDLSFYFVSVVLSVYIAYDMYTVDITRYRDLNRMQNEILTDSLTGCYNRKYLFDHGKKDFSLARRSKFDLSVLMIDLDHFKQINDNHGHQAGDKVLIQFAQRIEQSIRPGDRFGRYGGEEFMVILNNQTMEQAIALAERLRLAICAQQFSIGDQKIPVTISIGACHMNEAFDHFAEVVSKSDEALYKAKQNGRNRVASCIQT